MYENSMKIWHISNSNFWAKNKQFQSHFGNVCSKFLSKKSSCPSVDYSDAFLCPKKDMFDLYNLPLKSKMTSSLITMLISQ